MCSQIELLMGQTLGEGGGKGSTGQRPRTCLSIRQALLFKAMPPLQKHLAFKGMGDSLIGLMYVMPQTHL